VYAYLVPIIAENNRMSTRAAKLVALRTAVNGAIGTGSATADPKKCKQLPLPVPPLIDIIIGYAIEDHTISRLIGQTGVLGDAHNCNGLNALLRYPYRIAVVSDTEIVLRVPKTPIFYHIR
jgi:hypothetical protein